jgi:hypothetical protein
MVSAVLLCATVFAATPPAAAEDLAAYETARMQVGRSSDAHTRLALWCEAHGLGAERVKHLALAVLADPANATARGLMGLVAYRGRWERPDAVAERVKADEALSAALAEYNARRERMPETADAHWKLALWCEEQGLDAEAKAHLTAVVRLDPGREAAWKRLGCVRHNGRWRTEADIQAEKTEAEAQKRADRTWKPKLEKWRAWLADGSTAHRSTAEEGLRQVTDPRAVPAVWTVFATGNATLQAIAVRLFAQIDAPAASRALALLAVSSPSAEVRRTATEILARRDPRDFVGLVIGLLRKPIKYQVRPVNGPGSIGAVFVEGERFNVRRLYRSPALPADTLAVLANPAWLTFVAGRGVPQAMADPLYNPAASPLAQAMSASPADAPALLAAGQAQQAAPRTATAGTRGGAPGQNAAGDPIARALLQREMAFERNLMQAQAAALAAQQQLAADVNAIESYNGDVGETNQRVLSVLTNVTGQDLGPDGEAWRQWWTNQQGYAYRTPVPTEVPTFDQTVPLAFTPAFSPIFTTLQAGHSCFGAGTAVRTLEGPRLIESIRIGDQVLVQDPQSGALSFQPVVAVYHNSPNATLRVKLGDESIVVTDIHRFWKAGRGWTMARDLKPGDTLRMLDGTTTVAAVESDSVQPVFNLEVAGGHSFFVGAAGALVHDNSLVQPVPEPYDAAPSLTAVARPGP